MLPALVVSPLSRLDRAEPLERIGENVIAAETRVQAVISNRNSIGLFADKAKWALAPPRSKAWAKPRLLMISPPLAAPLAR